MPKFLSVEKALFEGKHDSSTRTASYSKLPVSTMSFFLFIILEHTIFILISQFYDLFLEMYKSQERFKLRIILLKIDDGKWDTTNESNLVLDVQTLTNFPAEKLDGEFVMLRFDLILLLEPLNLHNVLGNKTLSTIRYLYNAGAKVLLVSNWGKPGDPLLLSAESVAGYLSSLLKVKVILAKGVYSENSYKADILLFENLSHFREEVANCPVFSEKLASGANIFVNDAFFLSHKILASTVGAARFCYACLAGFHFEELLLQLKNIRAITMRPYFVIIGGGNFLEKAAALSLLASICDGVFFVGMLAFQVMHALGFSVPSIFLEHGAFSSASELIKLANIREIPICFPMDFWCVNDDNSELIEVFPFDRILPGNGLFPLKMAEKWKDLNFLGLEINTKHVMHCLDGICGCNRKNVHFISTNATSTFRSIVSTYPGELILVSIQCPNPDFNREGHRWRMVQRALVEAIIDLLAADAKIFLQSDVEAVTIRMKEQFIKYGKGRIIVDDDDEGSRWLAYNPFGVRSDWEQHIIDRGDLMYRTMLRKLCSPRCR